MSYLDAILNFGGPAPSRQITLPQLLSMQGAGVWDPTAYSDPQAGGGQWQPQVGPGWIQNFAGLPGQDFFAPEAAEGQFDLRRFQQYMRERGFTAAEASLGDNRFLRGIFDAQGNPVIPPEEFQYDGDQAFWNAGLAAMAVTGANMGLFSGLGGAAGGAGSGGTAAATAGTGTLGTIAPGAGAVAPISTAGLGPVAMPSLSAAAPTAGAGLSAGQWLQGINGGLNILGGLYGMRQAEKAAERMDPFGPYRAQYAQQLQQLLGNPGMVSTMPGFRSGIKALESSTAAGGYFGSGNAAAALTEFGGNFFQQEAARLAQLAGAGATPGAGALGALDITGRSMAGIGYGIGQLGKLLGG